MQIGTLKLYRNISGTIELKEGRYYRRFTGEISQSGR